MYLYCINTFNPNNLVQFSDQMVSVQTAGEHSWRSRISRFFCTKSSYCKQQNLSDNFLNYPLLIITLSQRVGHEPGRSKNQWRKALLTLLFAFLGFKRAQEFFKPLLPPPLIHLAPSELAKKRSSDQLNDGSDI